MAENIESKPEADVVHEILRVLEEALDEVHRIASDSEETREKGNGTGNGNGGFDAVDEASRESFPASDPPAY